MKHIIRILTVLTGLIAKDLTAQIPQQINYQAIVRDMGGVTVPGNTQVKLQFIIHDGSSGGTSVYSETSGLLTTNQFGLVTTAIGLNGTLSGVAWGSNTKWLQVKADVGNTGVFTDMGTTQMNAVPYALSALNSNAWSLTGSAGTDIHTNFIGTTDSNALAIKVNAIRAGLLGLGFVDAGGNPTGFNTSYGVGALNGITDEFMSWGNTAIGAGSQQGSTGYKNTTTGFRSLFNNTTGFGNAVFGASSFINNETGYQNLGFGSDVAHGCRTCYQNVFVGSQSAGEQDGSFDNVFLGFGAGNTMSFSQNNTLLGSNAQAADAISHSFSVGYGSMVEQSYSGVLGTVAGVNGEDSTSKIGIGTTRPTANLDLAGSFRLHDGSEGPGYILTSDASGNAHWNAAKIGFNALSNTGAISGTGNFIFDTENFDDGNGYDPTTGIYTVPVSGVYNFDVGIGYTGTGIVSSYARFSLTKNGTIAMSSLRACVPTTFTVTGATTLSLQAGDQISINTFVGDANVTWCGYVGATHFSGYKVY